MRKLMVILSVMGISAFVAAAQAEDAVPVEDAPAAAVETKAEEPAAEGITVQAQGLTGGFPVTVVLNDDGTIKAVTVGETDSDMDKNFLAQANTEEFLGQFVGKTVPVDGIDMTAGATVSKTAIVNAVNEALANK